jgi:hypothetical protein
VIARLEEFDGSVNHNGLEFSHQGRYLAAKGGTVARIWEVGKWDAPIRQFESTVHHFNNAVEFSADDATFATRVPGGVRFWDTSTWQESHFEENDATFGTILHYSHDGQWLAIADWHRIEIRSPKYELLASFERQIGIREWVELWVTAIARWRGDRLGDQDLAGSRAIPGTPELCAGIGLRTGRPNLGDRRQ